MNLHEFQAKKLFRDYGLPVPDGRVIEHAGQASEAIQALGGNEWVVKAQVHSGGRGKAGGVRRVAGAEEARAAAEELLGSRLVTAQSGEPGLPVECLLVEPVSRIERELYLAVLVDRGAERVTVIVSVAGGMDIEQVAAERPDAILRETLHPVAGLQGYQTRKLAFALGLTGDQIKAFASVLSAAVRLFHDCDASLLEINPLVVTGEGVLLALDAKLNLDDSALYRHSTLAELRDAGQMHPVEHAAHAHGLNYIALDGDIACMVNGAGLAMATMDLIKLHGGEPANFLDVGGGTTADKVAEAFRLILSDQKVRAILVNIFGGIVRCDLIAEGILQAVRAIQLKVPIVVRLEGTNAEQGLAMLRDSGVGVTAVEDLDEAARQAVLAAGGDLEL